MGVNTVKKIVPELIQYGQVQTPTLGISLFPPQYADFYRQRWGINGVIVLENREAGDTVEVLTQRDNRQQRYRIELQASRR